MKRAVLTESDYGLIRFCSSSVLEDLVKHKEMVRAVPLVSFGARISAISGRHGGSFARDRQPSTRTADVLYRLSTCCAGKLSISLTVCLL
jgi:hypothetical protein